MYASCEEWFKKVAEHADRQAAKETRAHTIEWFTEGGTKGAFGEEVCR